MPAPSFIVTIRDADGDDFPVRLWGLPEDYESGIQIGQVALNELRPLIEEGRLRPTFPVHVAKTEPPIPKWDNPNLTYHAD
jgi:hypothetical protein